jgi:hypothetical protein
MEPRNIICRFGQNCKMIGEDKNKINGLEVFASMHADDPAYIARSFESSP